MFTMQNVFELFQRWSKVCIVVDFFSTYQVKGFRFFNKLLSLIELLL